MRFVTDYWRTFIVTDYQWTLLVTDYRHILLVTDYRRTLSGELQANALYFLWQMFLLLFRRYNVFSNKKIVTKNPIFFFKQMSRDLKITIKNYWSKKYHKQLFHTPNMKDCFADKKKIQLLFHIHQIWDAFQDKIKEKKNTKEPDYTMFCSIRRYKERAQTVQNTFHNG